VKGTIQGKAYVLGDDVDTDQIIPAHHLVYDLDDPKEKKLYGVYALSGVPDANAGLPDGHIPFVPPGGHHSPYSIIVAGKNFGCGSSREHAPVALNVAGVKIVIATSYARIFYRNAVDGGYLIPYESVDYLPTDVSTNDLLEIDCGLNELRNIITRKTHLLKPLGELAEIIDAGGIFQYAQRYRMLK
jgi:3-isopropylmalate/(R)-2-methylmalate dehydratase small subunit